MTLDPAERREEELRSWRRSAGRLDRLRRHERRLQAAGARVWQRLEAGTTTDRARDADLLYRLDTRLVEVRELRRCWERIMEKGDR